MTVVLVDAVNDESPYRNETCDPELPYFPLIQTVHQDPLAEVYALHQQALAHEPNATWEVIFGEPLLDGRAPSPVYPELGATATNVTDEPAFSFVTWVRVSANRSGTVFAKTSNGGGFIYQWLYIEEGTDLRQRVYFQTTQPGDTSVRVSAVWVLRDDIRFDDNVWHMLGVSVQHPQVSPGRRVCLLQDRGRCPIICSVLPPLARFHSSSMLSGSSPRLW